MSRLTIAVAAAALASASIAAPVAAQEPAPSPTHEPSSAPAPAGANTGTAERGFRWYLAPAAQITQINGEAAVLTGLEFGWMKTPRLTLGLATYRLATGIAADRPDAGGARDIEFFYSGVTASYALCRHDGFRLAPRLLLGGGEAHWRDGYWNAVPDPDHRDEEHTTSLVAEPGISAEVALMPWLRMDLAGAYRWVGGGASNVVEQSDMRGFSATVGLRLGRY